MNPKYLTAHESVVDVGIVLAGTAKKCHCRVARSHHTCTVALRLQSFTQSLNSTLIPIIDVDVNICFLQWAQ